MGSGTKRPYIQASTCELGQEGAGSSWPCGHMKTVSLCFENQAFLGLAVLLTALRRDTQLQGPHAPVFPQPNWEGSPMEDRPFQLSMPSVASDTVKTQTTPLCPFVYRTF